MKLPSYDNSFLHVAREVGGGEELVFTTEEVDEITRRF